ncbi:MULTISPECIES: conjugal transfer protein [Streptococcus]|uniref:conjugal transfer protein n=1 Tax=Streptococcus TaxID=1301 RepID=UPI001C8D1774|nr:MULTISPECIES: conjugal transfer protein [Streptococcus]MBY0720558.1 conjugal transfer protein [Streptococcus sp. 2018110]MCO8236081.1 conjugal transfer protein [Streptococcus suis]HEM3553342.1 conjugal transfer protein [Streptococcus suis]
MKNAPIFQSLKTYFARFKKMKKVKNAPTLTLVRQKTANMLVYGLLLVLFLVGLLGAFRAIGLSSNVATLGSQVERFEASLSDLPKNNQIDISKVRQYMSDFLKIYLTYDANTADQRLKELDYYFSFGMSGYTDSIKQNRTYTGSSLIGLTEEDGFYIADMKVSFETVEQGQTVSKVRVLSIPFRIDNGLLSIISPPYFKKEDSLLGEAEPLKRKKREDVTVLDESEQDSIQEFLTVFFDKYALSGEVDLGLVMKEPFLMGGQYTVDSIREDSLLMYQEDKQVIVQVSVDFLDKGNGAVHTENFTLYLQNQDNGWYVEKMYHYFK